MKKAGNSVARKDFTRLLLKWNREQNFRAMPWKGEKDPYRIWLSEIILQQTRVEQGTAYYHAFVQAFPDIHSLAKAPEQKIFKYWEGLGYYSRCRNLIATAKFISTERAGRFPNSYLEILSLKGVGPYTAAAISSFAFNLPHAVVDGNVIRVLARYFGISDSAENAKGKKIFTDLAQELMDPETPGQYNQAIMDFGATVCKPRSPNCKECVLRKTCFAYTHGKTGDFPLAKSRVRIRNRWFYFLVMEYRGTVAIRLREGKDIWRGLYEFPLLEFASAQSPETVIKVAKKNKWLVGGSFIPGTVSPQLRQQLSHQLIRGRVLSISVTKKSRVPGWTWVKKNSLLNLAFPRFIRKYLESVKRY